jgi:hypothetical protein
MTYPDRRERERKERDIYIGHYRTNMGCNGKMMVYNDG